MKIRENTILAYTTPGVGIWEIKELQLTLQQAVAENLDLQHRLVVHPSDRFCDGCNNADWLAEADKLLRGQK